MCLCQKTIKYCRYVFLENGKSSYAKYLKIRDPHIFSRIVISYPLADSFKYLLCQQMAPTAQLYSWQITKVCLQTIKNSILPAKGYEIIIREKKRQSQNFSMPNIYLLFITLFCQIPCSNLKLLLLTLVCMQVNGTQASDWLNCSPRSPNQRTGFQYASN